MLASAHPIKGIRWTVQMGRISIAGIRMQSFIPREIPLRSRSGAHPDLQEVKSTCYKHVRRREEGKCHRLEPNLNLEQVIIKTVLANTKIYCTCACVCQSSVAQPLLTVISIYYTPSAENSEFIECEIQSSHREHEGVMREESNV